MDTVKESIDSLMDKAKVLGYKQGLIESIEIIRNASISAHEGTGQDVMTPEGIIAIIELLQIKIDASPSVIALAQREWSPLK